MSRIGRIVDTRQTEPVHDVGSLAHYCAGFDKFTRLKNKNGPAGLGVGLAFCKLAVQGHGGSIWVEEAVPEKGSRFVFTLPIANEK